MTNPAKSIPAKRSDTSADIAMCHQLWKTANESPVAISIPCGTTGEANRMRTTLYNSVRNVKNYPQDYPDLVGPVANCELVFSDDTKTTLLIRRKSLSPRMQALRQILERQGVKVGDEALAGTPDTRDAAASAQRLQSLLQAEGHSSNFPPSAPQNPPDQSTINNPFFTRG